MMISLPGTEIGRLKVLMSVGDTPETEVSFCQVVNGNLSQYIASNDFSMLYVEDK
jgi:hypothetical protein